MSSAASTPRWSTSSVRLNPPSRAATTRSRSGGEQPSDPANVLEAEREDRLPVLVLQFAD